MSASFYNVSPGYFATLQIPVARRPRLQRRSTRDRRRSWRLSTAPLADRLFEGDAIGKQLRSGRGGAPMQIVGVVEDGKYTALSEARARGHLPAAVATVLNLVDADRPRAAPGAVRHRGSAAGDPPHRSQPADSIVGDGRTNHGAALVSVPRRGGRARPAWIDCERAAALGSARDAGLRGGQAPARDRHPHGPRRRSRQRGSCRAVAGVRDSRRSVSRSGPCCRRARVRWCRRWCSASHRRSPSSSWPSSVCWR